MIEVDIVTPTKKLVEAAKVNAVRMPGVKGELLVLPGHSELLTLLGTGLIGFVMDGTERKFAVSHGFAEVRNDKVLILAETCEEGKDIDVIRAKKAQKVAEEALSAVLTRENFRKYELKMQRSVVRQQAGE